MDIDSVQDKEKAYFFLWKPETGNLMYCMPEIGTKVYLNVTERDEGNAHAVSCIRLNGSLCPDTQVPDKRFFSNEFGKNIKLYPQLLECQGKKENTFNSVFSIGDNSGLLFQTDQSFIIKAEGNVQFKGKKVKLSSSREFTAVKKDLLSPTVMNLNHTIDILGKYGKITSDAGKKFSPLIHGKHVENYDITDIEEQLLSAIPQDEETDEVSAILAASFMSTLYSEK